MARTVKIYTKTGDRGTTSLFGGQRVEKTSGRIKTYGEVDELNSLIGVVLSENPSEEIAEKLTRIQTELFVFGSDLATPYGIKIKVPRISALNVKRLEKEIDLWTKKLPQLRNFIMPGGSPIASKLHLARTICRRAERNIVELAASEKINKNAQVYINRLSDWFFVLARFANRLDGQKETIWLGRAKS